jgi:hypothetical protein
MKLAKTMAWLAAAAVVVLGAGCGSDNKEKPYNEFFKADSGDRVNAFNNVQASNGARNDAMLYPQHFEGGHLNSLGRSKVLLMLEDCENCDPIVVHLVNCGEGDTLAQRKASVELYLKTTEGANALTFHPSAPDIVRLAKTESPGDGGGAAGGAPEGGAGGGGATGGMTGGMTK